MVLASNFEVKITPTLSRTGGHPLTARIQTIWWASLHSAKTGNRMPAYLTADKVLVLMLVRLARTLTVHRHVEAHGVFGLIQSPLVSLTTI
jgi:hypothetical protein